LVVKNVLLLKIIYEITVFDKHIGDRVVIKTILSYEVFVTRSNLPWGIRRLIVLNSEGFESGGEEFEDGVSGHFVFLYFVKDNL
jgi:hypothetical protein